MEQTQKENGVGIVSEMFMHAIGLSVASVLSTMSKTAKYAIEKSEGPTLPPPSQIERGM